MVWLLHNYFLPTINPSAAPESQTKLRSLEPVLKEYKKLLKITTRDTSLRTRNKPAILAALKDVERWIAEARVAANMGTREIGWETITLEVLSEMDPKERWALEQLCDALLEKGFLVSLSKKKRDFPAETFLPPKFSVQLWAPMLQHLQSLHSEFYFILAGRIISTLLPEGHSQSTEIPPDASYDMCLARWVKWSVEAHDENESAVGFDLRKEVTIAIMQSLGHVESSPLKDRKAAMTLLESLCTGVPELDSTLDALKFLSSDVQPSVRYFGHF
ncbi:hypothetical protein C0991_009422 [Blastosporella zonata]|nr:hypothetical protein C0991_009422 [Blastosporella zonata]